MILDTSAFRRLVRQPDVPVAALDGGELHVCRLVFDPDEDIFGLETALSAIGRSVASGMRRAGAVSDPQGQLQRARALISDGTVTLVEMTGQELRLWSVVKREASEATPLGVSAAAAGVIAIARCRSWAVVSEDPDVVAFLRTCGSRVVDISAT